MVLVEEGSPKTQFSLVTLHSDGLSFSLKERLKVVFSGSLCASSGCTWFNRIRKLWCPWKAAEYQNPDRAPMITDVRAVLYTRRERIIVFSWFEFGSWLLALCSEEEPAPCSWAHLCRRLFPQLHCPPPSQGQGTVPETVMKKYKEKDSELSFTAWVALPAVHVHEEQEVFFFFLLHRYCLISMFTRELFSFNYIDSCKPIESAAPKLFIVKASLAFMPLCVTEKIIRRLWETEKEED